jgi:protein phosphatase
MMRAIDGIHAVEVDLSVRETREGDRYLLCSDGLCGVIDSNQIAECLSHEDLTQAVTLLIDAAMAAGAPDNITVVVADVVNDSLEFDPVLIGSAADSLNQSRLPAVEFPDEGEASVQVDDRDFLQSGKSWLVPVLSTIGVIATGIAATLWWLANQWFVGVYEKENVVAIFQGIPAGGMYRLVEITEIDAGKLPDYERDQVYQTFESDDFESSEAAVERLKLSADLCVLTPAEPGCPEIAQ